MSEEITKSDVNGGMAIGVEKDGQDMEIKRIKEIEKTLERNERRDRKNNVIIKRLRIDGNKEVKEFLEGSRRGDRTERSKRIQRKG